MSVLIVFPFGKEASADSYIDFCEAHDPAAGPGVNWYPRDIVDIYGQRVVGYLGPTGYMWNAEPFPEPEGGPEARADGVMNANVEWPET